ncbi:MAG: hypothetical protein Q9207_007867 [Kuettlingeria erythrocarpa]
MLVSSICSYIALTAVIHAIADPSRRTGSHIRPTADALSPTDLMLNASAAGYKAGSAQCAEVFGHPPLSSCMEALSIIPRNDRQETFGQRTGRFVDHVMPFTLVSCTRGALAIRVNSNIDVRSIRCLPVATAPTEVDCLTVIDHIPATAKHESFGPEGWHVDVLLPTVFRQRAFPEPGCAVAVNLLADVEISSSWVLLWTAALTVNAMCVRRGMKGQWIGSGGIRASKSGI